MNMQQIMQQAQKMQKDMMNKTEEINQMTFVGKSDWVEISFKGNKEVVSVNITNNNAFSEDNKDFLCDMIQLAVNDGIKQIEAETEKKLGAYANIYNFSGLVKKEEDDEEIEKNEEKKEVENKPEEPQEEGKKKKKGKKQNKQKKKGGQNLDNLDDLLKEFGVEVSEDKDKKEEKQKQKPKEKPKEQEPKEENKDNDTKDDRFDTWFDALDYMVKECAKTEFDVAIVGCGAYGYPLAAEIKKMGKTVIHLGGATQLMFGIIGNRWETTHIGIKDNIMNDYWVHPDVSERPTDASKVEKGCYW